MNEQRRLQAAGKKGAIGVLIVDDHEAVRRGLATFLEAFDDLCLVGEASDGKEALHLCQELKPDVILMDLAMPGSDSAAAIRDIHQVHADVPVVGLASFDDQYRVKEALQAGAACCLRKDVPIDLLAKTIRDVHRIRQAGLPPPPGLSAP